MKKSKLLAFFTALASSAVMLFSAFPVSAATITVSDKTELLAALTSANDGDIIQFSSNITASISYTVDPNITITIDGAGHTLTGENELPTPTDTRALILVGSGDINIVNLNIVGGNTAANNGMSIGLYAFATVSINAGAPSTTATWLTAAGGHSSGTGVTKSYGAFYAGAGTGTFKLKSATGSTGTSSIGIQNASSGDVLLDTAESHSSTTDVDYGYGVINSGSGSTTIMTATGGNAKQYSFGVAASNGSIIVDEAYGGSTDTTNGNDISYGAQSYGDGSITVTSLAVGGNNVTTSYGVYCQDGSIVVDSATGGNSCENSYGAYCANGTLTVDSAVGGTANISSYGAYCTNGTLNVSTAATGGPSNNSSFGAILNGSGTISAFDATGGTAQRSYGAFRADNSSGNIYITGTALGGTASDKSVGAMCQLMNTPNGMGEFIVRNATGGQATGTGQSVGASIYQNSVGDMTVTETATGGASENSSSCGVANEGTGTLNVNVAIGGTSTGGTSGAVSNIGGGVVNVKTATGGNGDDDAFGIYNFSGIVNAGDVSSGTSANESSIAIYCLNGTVNAHSATPGTADNGSSIAVYVDHANAIVNVETMNGPEAAGMGGTVSYGANVARLALNRNTANEDCILDYIVVKASGSTNVGVLSTIYSGGNAASWYTNAAKTALFADASVTAETKLYSPLYVVPADNNNNNNNNPPISTGGSYTPAEPQISGDSGTKGWTAIEDKIKATAEGGKVVIDMKGTSVVPKKIFEAIKGKDITIEVIINGITWVINGKDIDDGDLKDVDLSISRGMNLIPASIVDKLRGSNQAIQIHLNFSGKFGFRATLNIDMGSANSGKYANLFYYNPTTKQFEYVSSGKIGSDGKAGLDFNHASDYVVVISSEIMSVPAADPSNEPAENPKTGDRTVPFVMIAAVVVLSACTIKLKKAK